MTAMRLLVSGRTASQLLVVSTSLLALILCPHSKVEESFPLHATHDLFYHGVSPIFFGEGELQYDHLMYPGVVPRSFAGPFFLAYIVRFLGILVTPVFDLWAHPTWVQFLCRFVLLAFHWHAWFRLAHASSVKFKSPLIGNYMLILTACQFHLPFYGSRMLPNVFALIMVTHSFSDWFHGKIRRAATCLVVGTVIFRCDILLLLFTVGLAWLFTRQLGFWEALHVGLLAGIVSLVVTLPLDSLLWQRPVWPEGEVFWFNTILGKSSEWGTSPWYWYVSSALPKSMLLSILLVPLSFLRIPEKLVQWEKQSRVSPGAKLKLLDTSLLPYLLPIMGFIAIYSFLAHKEMRFIFPALPMLNIAAAAGLTRLHGQAFPAIVKDKTDYGPSYLARVAFLGGIICVTITWIGSLAFLAVSSHNYPGGDALNLLIHHVNLVNKGSDIRVHVDVASAMTGVSLFGQREAELSSSQQRQWTFEKAGYEEENRVSKYDAFTHILSENRDIPGFQVVNVAQGQPRLDIRKAEIVTKDTIFVLEQIAWSNSN